MSAKTIGLTCAVMTAVVFLSGCVERKLTVNTIPEGALVTLNDEEIGRGPVTTSFNWYGDYNVTLRKSGYETLKTHRQLNGPWYDYFPFDFFANFINPKRIVDSYEWTFALEEKKHPSREQLTKSAEILKREAQIAERMYSE